MNSNSKVASKRMRFPRNDIFIFVCNDLQLMVRLVVKEWQFTDGSHSSNNFSLSSQPSLYGSSNFPSGTGRKIIITVVEGKDLIASKSGRCDPYVKLQYGKVGLSVSSLNGMSNSPNLLLSSAPFLNNAMLNVWC